MANHVDNRSSSPANTAASSTPTMANHALASSPHPSNVSAAIDGLSYVTVPTSMTNSSKRTRAYSIAGHTSNKKSRNAAHKNKKLNENLVEVPLPDTKYRLDESRLEKEVIFVDGGKKGNEPINPTYNVENNKRVTILSMDRRDLYVVRNHFKSNHKRKGRGVRYRKNGNGAMVFTLCPRQEALNAVRDLNGDGAAQLAESYSASIAAARSSLKRGKSSIVMSDDSSNKYVCVGSAANRAAKGITALHYVVKKLGIDHQQHILNHTLAVEKLFTEWIDTPSVRQVKIAIEKSRVPLFTTTNGASAKIYQAFAVGKNVYLNTHIDRDFTYSAITIIASGPLEDIVAYFCFPTLGLAVPLRPFDVLFFDPSVPHNVSSRCDNQRQIFCLSFYLKSNLIGGNDNSRNLTDEEQDLLDLFEKTHANK